MGLSRPVAAKRMRVYVPWWALRAHGLLTVLHSGGLKLAFVLFENECFALFSDLTTHVDLLCVICYSFLQGSNALEDLTNEGCITQRTNRSKILSLLEAFKGRLHLFVVLVLHSKVVVRNTQRLVQQWPALDIYLAEHLLCHPDLVHYALLLLGVGHKFDFDDLEGVQDVGDGRSAELDGLLVLAHERKDGADVELGAGDVAALQVALFFEIER